jgi:hypothetical protein
MGLFSSLFGNPNSLETRLINEYVMAFRACGKGAHESKTMASEMLTRAKQEAAQRGWLNQPPNYGDLLLQQEASNPMVHAALETVREDGVRNEDIRWWWNLHPLERVMMEKSDELNRTAAFVTTSSFTQLPRPC